MTPLEFEDSTIYAKNQPQYLPLPALRKPDGRIMISWKLSWKERFRLFFTGTLYHQVLTYNQPLQPILLTVDYPEEFINNHITNDEIQKSYGFPFGKDN